MIIKNNATIHTSTNENTKSYGYHNSPYPLVMCTFVKIIVNPYPHLIGCGKAAN